MLESLFPYSEYKESGHPCFGQIPAHWQVLRNGQIFSQRNQTGFPKLPILEVSLKTGVRVRDFENSKRKQVMHDRSKYKLAGKGDIAYNMMRMWQGAVGVAPVDGLVSPAYVVASPLSEVDSRYYAYLFRTHAYMNEVNKYSHGIVADRNRLYWDEFKQMPSLFPPHDEQKKIADFLDAHGRKVAKLVRIKRRQIELLRDYKQAIINDAVTKGLNPDVKMKPTGVEGLGEIPEHWVIKRIKAIVRNVTLHTNNKSQDEIYIGLENVEGWTGRIINASTEAYFDSLAKRFESNDILFGKLRPYLAKVAKLTKNGVCSGEFLVLRIIDINCLDNYVALSLRSKIVIDTITSCTYGAKMPRVEWSFLGELLIPIPPVNEQKIIVESMTNYTSVIDRSIEVQEQELTLVNEYRNRLISDVVLGRIDVRDVNIDNPIINDTNNYYDIDEDDSDNEDISSEGSVV